MREAPEEKALPRLRDVARELALEGLSAHEIQRKLRERFAAGIPALSALERIIRETDAAGQAMGPPPEKIFPRILGSVAILMGSGALYMGNGIGGRYSPAGFGGVAVILGLVLLFRPQWAGRDAYPHFDFTWSGLLRKNRRD